MLVTLLRYALHFRCLQITVIAAFQKYRLDILLILIILSVGSLALFFKIGEIPPTYPWSDESDVASDAVASARDGLQFHYPAQLAGGPVAIWLETGWIVLFGPDLVGLRVLNGLVNLTSMLLLYLLVRQLPFRTRPGWYIRGPAFNQWLAFTSVLFMAISTWILGLARIATPNWSLVPPMTTLTFYFLWRALNTDRWGYFVAAGVMMGLLFYGYIPGYTVPFVPAIFLGVLWLSRQRQAQLSFPPSALYLLPFPIALIVATPIFVYFVLHPDAVLQRVVQLAHTNELSLTNLLTDNIVDTLSAFGFWPNWLLQGRFEHVAFGPLATVLFIVGFLIVLRRWRENVYLFVLIWWVVMILPAVLSRSSSYGFIFEVWRRGIGAQPVSFIFPALAVVVAGQWLQQWAGRNYQPLRNPGVESESGWLSIRRAVILPSLIVILAIISAGLSYWLYFGRWANSGVIPTFFPAGPVRLVEWMETESQADMLFIFPIRPKVSPTTRPELFTVRYLYDGPATTAFPVMDETIVNQELTALLETQPAVVKLMTHDRIVVDPKGYFEYVLSSQGKMVGREHLPDYFVSTYRMRPEISFDTSLTSTDVAFGEALHLTGYRIQPEPLTAGQSLSVALRWLMQTPNDVDYNVSLTLYDAQDYLWTKVDKPLLSGETYLTTRHWLSGTESTGYYTVPIPPDAPPGRYRLQVVVYDAERGMQLPPVGGQTDLSLLLAEVTVLPNPEPVELADLTIARPLAVKFPGKLRLVGAASSASTVRRPGDRLWVTLWCQATQPLSHNIGLELTLTGLNGEPVSLFDQPLPLLVDYPTTAWPVGQVFRVNYPVRIPAMMTTGDYLFSLRLFDLETLKPLAEQLLFPIFVEARSHIFEAPTLANQVDIDFGETIRLRSFELGELSSHQSVRLKLQWQALREMSESYKVFLHLIDASGQIVSQIDTLPQQGAALTPGWITGEIIEDELNLTVPAEIPTDTYQLVVGWYDEETGERLMPGQGDSVILVDGITLP